MIQTEKEKNFGIQILKSLMCFIVICCHFYTSNVSTSGAKILIEKYRLVAVPIFMIISAYFSFKIINNVEKRKFMNKIFTLFYTQAIWALIYFVIYSIITRKIYPISSLMWQLFFGTSDLLNATMWYQFDLIILLIIFYFISKIFSKNKQFIYLILCVCSLYIQYSGINYNFFNTMIPEIKYSLGRLVEMVPSFTTGLLVAKYDLLNKCKQNWKKSIFISIITLNVLLNQSIFISPTGFCYSGINNVIIALLTIITFYVMPLEKNNKKCLKIINYITNYTMGIYFCHRLVANLIMNLFPKYNYMFFSLRFCILIYITCYVLCFIIKHIPVRMAKNMV